MESSIRKHSLESIFIQIIKGIFKVKCSNSIKRINNKSKGVRIKKNELDYFEYIYLSD